MPLMLPFRKTHPFPLDRMGNNHCWLIGVSGCLGALQSGKNLRKIVPCNFEAAPAQPLEYPSQIDSRPWVLTIPTMLLVNCQDPTELLKPIPVQNCGQIAKLISRRDVQRLPNHALL